MNETTPCVAGPESAKNKFTYSCVAGQWTDPCNGEKKHVLFFGVEVGEDGKLTAIISQWPTGVPADQIATYVEKQDGEEHK